MIDVNYNEYKETIEENMKLIQENHKLKEIIKEVREYIKNTYQDYKNEDSSLPLTLHDQELLEILDKVDKENNNEDN